MSGATRSLWRFSPDERTLIAGALLNSMAFFAVLPFASLYLSDRTELSVPLIGAVVGGIALIAAVGGLFGGLLVDRSRAVRLMGMGLAANVAVYAALALVGIPEPIVPLLLLLGAVRTLVEPGTKKLLSLADTGDGRIFRVRYITLCLGAIIGPAVGAVLYNISPVAFFLVPAFLFFLYLLLLLSRSRSLNALEGPKSPAPPSSALAVSTALRDRSLLLAVGAGAVIFLVFSQVESIIPLYMRERYADRTEYLFALLLICNAVLALAVQPAIMWLSERLPRRSLVLLGSVSFTLAFVFFWLSPVHLALLYVGIVFWTLGEAILLPLPDIAVHELAVDERKGTYFGLSELRHLGFFVGPVTGGWLLTINASVYFLFMGLFVFLCVPLLLGIRGAAAGTDEDPEPALSSGPDQA
ncbi:MFS transporter [Nocardiopsis alba]|jgi:MFS family permease|uniref:MFS transporter n=1 Tax=Nocardiopsis alba TaxID=53437 RepID=UPI000349EF03|nr:MFS transporter [Nocardiopsis alba]